MTRIAKKQVQKVCEKSAKIIQLNEWQCRDAPCEKLWKQEVS